MSKTHFEPSIKSRPVYGVLEARTGSEHVFVANAEGAEAILDLAKAASADFWTKAHIIYVPGRSGETFQDALKALGAPKFYIASNVASALNRLVRALEDCRMGTQFYLTGTEGLMGQAQRDIMAAGISHMSVQTEHRGSLARRVQCVHCKGVAEEVTTDPYQCPHCDLHLFVRDHYSRRLAAFQGVRIDAEDHGNVPPAEEVFP
ncbi:MAG: dimethylamine monooxygenase subunit DmmA family protein [Alphaproteobacteria bacterium]|jgi:hypothetical protein